MNSSGWRSQKNSLSINSGGLQQPLFRFATSAGLFAAVLFAPWWVSAILGIIATLYFPKFYEAVAMALLFDILYGTSIEWLNGFQFIFSAVVIVILVISEWARGYLRWY